jgi:hypothetical protein
MGSSKDFSIVTRILMDTAGFTTGKDKITSEGKAMERAISSSADAMKTSFGALTNTALPALAGQFGALGGVISGMKPIFENLVKAAATADAAIISTGIGAVIIAITLAVAGLISWMKRTDEGGDKMKAVWNSIKAVFEVVMDKLAHVGKALYELSQGHFEAAYNELKEAVTGWGKAMDEAKEKADALTQAQIKSREFDVTYLLKRSVMEADIADKQLEAHKKLESTGKFDQKANEELVALKTKMYYLDYDRLDLQTKQAEAEKKMGADNDATNKKLNDILAQKNQLYAAYSQSLRENEKLDNKNLLNDVQRQALADKQLKIQEQIMQLKDKAVTYSLTGYQQEQKAIELKYASDILMAKDNDKLKTAITEEYLAHLLAITKKNEQAIQNLKNETILASMDGQIKEQTAIDQKYAEEYAAAEGNAAMQTALDEKHIAESLAIQKKYDDEAAKEAKKAADEKFKDQKKDLETQKKLINETANAVVGVTDAFGKLLGGIKGGFKEVVSSMLSGVQQIIDSLLAEAIAAAIAGEAHKGLIGLITGAIAVAGVMALWSKVPSFASGGLAPNSGYFLAGENGVELIQGAGQRVYNNTETNNILNNSGGVLTTKVSGTDLLIILNNTQKHINSFA